MAGSYAACRVVGDHNDGCQHYHDRIDSDVGREEVRDGRERLGYTNDRKRLRAAMSQSDDDDDLEKYRERAHAVSRLFRRKPRNMAEEIQELGLSWHDDGVDADELAEEQSARPITADQMALASFLEGSSSPNDHLVALWRTELRRDDTPLALWRRYFRAGSPQMKKLILLGLDQIPADRDLLGQLTFFHEFLPIPKELLARYTRACGEEDDPQGFMVLAQDFDEAADSFGYDALLALRERHANDPSKMVAIEELSRQKAQQKNETIVFQGQQRGAKKILP